MEYEKEKGFKIKSCSTVWPHSEHSPAGLDQQWPKPGYIAAKLASPTWPVSAMLAQEACITSLM
jgi:hypothetical protein